mmetsp:Transcript_36161/g.95309  ORF Transcript_36161/g.95309 Transcript_36161/m.95309 type:complete len:337 (-) Transcript_36161:892-1902(-)
MMHAKHILRLPHAEAAAALAKVAHALAVVVRLPRGPMLARIPRSDRPPVPECADDTRLPVCFPLCNRRVHDDVVVYVAVDTDELQLRAVDDEHALVGAECDPASEVDIDALVIVRHPIVDLSCAARNSAHKVWLPHTIDAPIHVAEHAPLGTVVEPPPAVNADHNSTRLILAAVIRHGAVVGFVNVRAITRIVDQQVVGIVGVHGHRLARLVELDLPFSRRLIDNGSNVNHPPRLVGPQAATDDGVVERLAFAKVRDTDSVRPPRRGARWRRYEAPRRVDERPFHQRYVAKACVRTHKDVLLAVDSPILEAVGHTPCLCLHHVRPALRTVERLEDA